MAKADLVGSGEKTLYLVQSPPNSPIPEKPVTGIIIYTFFLLLSPPEPILTAEG